MILSLAALLLAPASQASLGQEAPEEEIVVRARQERMRVRLKLDRKRRVRACAIAKSSGDAGFDRTACETTVACARSGLREPDAIRACVRPQLLAYARAQLGKEE
ncbi:TonB family protein [Sphingomonas psychrotolerans]|uniref:TonB family protein n=1 Tax=Sphingomonas psychrotolerans TaxID=1327635 RepID=A0ABU3N3R8_9SPHN|nr:TonB family protein [Sphingomonas psychrotolerans]MDT8759108.1 TonB family protein [Sphingomonas psychrotolerans]